MSNIFLKADMVNTPFSPRFHHICYVSLQELLTLLNQIIFSVSNLTHFFFPQDLPCCKVRVAR